LFNADQHLFGAGAVCFWGGIMLTTMDKSNKEKINQRKILKQFLCANAAKKFTRQDLVDCEAGIVFLEEMVRDLEEFMSHRKDSKTKHLGEVEKRIDELGIIYLEGFRKELRASVNAWGRRPFEDFVHEKGTYE
jgi:hypothetical protein